MNSTTEHTLASVYKRSFTPDIRNCKKSPLPRATHRIRAYFHRRSNSLPQVQELRSAGCVEIVEEQASGGSRSRPVLARALDQLRVGDTLVVVRIDRLARSLSHLLEIIERLEAKGAHFRSLQLSLIHI